MNAVLSGTLDYQVGYEQINSEVVNIIVIISGGSLSIPIEGRCYIFTDGFNELKDEIKIGINRAYENALNDLRLVLINDNTKVLLKELDDK